MRMLRDPQILLLSASYFCSNYVFYFFFNWLFIYLVENRGFKVLESGFFAAVPWMSGAVGALARRDAVRPGVRAAGQAGAGPHQWVAMAGLASRASMILGRRHVRRHRSSPFCSCRSVWDSSR